MRFIQTSILALTVLGLFAVGASAQTDSQRIQDEVKKHLANIQSSSYHAQTCSVILADLESQMRQIQWNAYSNEDLKANASATMELFWRVRLAIHQKLASVEKGCILQARDIFRLLRDGEDYLGEFAYTVPNLKPEEIDFQKQPVPIYDRAAYPPYFIRADVDDAKFKIKSGDLMMARGVSFISAIISQISDNRSHFSHIVFWSVDPQTQTPSTIEAYVGSGSKQYEENFALKNENARLVLLRPKDEALGKRASGYALKAAAARVPYDYRMNFQDYSVMSCVEVAVYSYDKASEGTIKLPAYSARLVQKNDDFLNKMSLKRGPLTTPDDLETDPNFDLVLEWRDYRLVRDSRHKDAILSEMMRWMNDLGYKFHETPRSLFAKYILQPSRRTPLWSLVQKITRAPDLDKEIPRDTLGVMTVLNDVGTKLLGEIRKQDDAYISIHRRPMTNEQLREALDKLRREDLQRYTYRQKSLIHKAIRP